MICQAILGKKWEVLIKKESESITFASIKISKDYLKVLEEIDYEI